MASMNDLFTQILYAVQDLTKGNYNDTEALIYFNDALAFLSKEVARLNLSIGVSETTLVYGVGEYSKALPDTFLSFALNEKGEPRVFNQTNNYTLMGRASVVDLDDWASETAADTGTPSEWIIDGLNLIVHPRAKVSTTVRYRYFPLQSGSNLNTVMPWNGFFNEAVKQFVLGVMHKRSEMGGAFQIDNMEWQILKTAASDMLVRREDARIRLRPSRAYYWSE